MRRRVLLIRHAMPDLPLGERWCVGGRTDLPLGRLGRMQAALLPFSDELRDVGGVFCSTLVRARQTALPLCAEPIAMPGLQEQDMGEWDGLSFREIRARFGALYAARERDPSLLPAGAESEAAVKTRMLQGIKACLRERGGDIAVVSHKGSIASLLGSREGLDYTAVCELVFDGETLCSCALRGVPKVALSDEVCRALLRAAAGREELAAHSFAVAALADKLAAALAEKGLAMDGDRVHFGALLHDIAKGEADHAALGGRYLEALGYGGLAPIAAQHRDWDGEALDEAAIVYLADKAVRGSERVSIDERFAASLEKCRTEEARAAHARRYAAARRIREEINRLCEKELI